MPRHVTGKWEFEVDPARSRQAREWVAGLRRRYEKEVGPIRFLRGSAVENGFRLDDSVCGVFFSVTGQIVIFYSEENNIASEGEELAHYFQYKRQRLLGKTEGTIGADTIDRNESAMRHIMISHGFRIRR